MKAPTKFLSLLLCAAGALNADRIETTNGSILTGTITLIDKGVIHLETSYAGTLKIDQSQVASFESEEPRVVRLASGTVMAGPISGDSTGTIRIRSEDGVLETNPSKVAAAWSPGAEDPEVARSRREWRYNAQLDVNGDTGNNENFRLGAGLRAELKGPDDTLTFFFNYEQADENGNKTEDMAIGGASYESFFSEVFGWYARTELETDNIDNIKMRSTNGAGLSYRLINTENQSLIARTGAGYRYTAFDNDKDDESSPTLDFGLAHSYRFNEIARMVNEITFVPAIDDFSVYRVVHDSGFEIPIGSGDNWKIRVGISNEYESEPAAEENLDTSYYTRMIYSWD
jgi:putative salt-induced outer membrane protein YdiY